MRRFALDTHYWFEPYEHTISDSAVASLACDAGSRADISFCPTKQVFVPSSGRLSDRVEIRAKVSILTNTFVPSSDLTAPNRAASASVLGAERLG
jgi:hypothetical protein